MKLEDLFSKDFFKVFNTSEEITSFFMHRKCPLEEMLEGEIDDNLGCDKCQLSEN